MTVWVRDPGVLWRRSFGRLLLKRPETADIVTLDGPAVALWDALDEPVQLEPLVQRVAAVYDVAPSAVRDDLSPVLEVLEQRRLVLRRPA